MAPPVRPIPPDWDKPVFEIFRDAAGNLGEVFYEGALAYEKDRPHEGDAKAAAAAASKAAAATNDTIKGLILDHLMLFNAASDQPQSSDAINKHKAPHLLMSEIAVCGAPRDPKNREAFKDSLSAQGSLLRSRVPMTSRFSLCPDPNVLDGLARESLYFQIRSVATMSKVQKRKAADRSFPFTHPLTGEVEAGEKAQYAAITNPHGMKLRTDEGASKQWRELWNLFVPSDFVSPNPFLAHLDPEHCKLVLLMAPKREEISEKAMRNLYIAFYYWIQKYQETKKPGSYLELIELALNLVDPDFKVGVTTATDGKKEIEILSASSSRDKLEKAPGLTPLQIAAGMPVQMEVTKCAPSIVDPKVLVVVPTIIKRGDREGHKTTHIFPGTVMRDDTRLIKLLLSRGADRSIKDSSGKTALQIAKDAEHLDMAEVLRDCDPTSRSRSGSSVEDAAADEAEKKESMQADKKWEADMQKSRERGASSAEESVGVKALPTKPKVAGRRPPSRKPSDPPAPARVAAAVAAVAATPAPAPVAAAPSCKIKVPRRVVGKGKYPVTPRPSAFLRALAERIQDAQ